MDIRELLVELRRPYAIRLLVIYAVLVTLLSLALAGLWLPAQRAAQAVQEAQRLVEREQYLRDNLRQFLPQAAALDQVLPGLMRRSEWQGPVTAFSGAVLDAANLAGITILEETNEVEDMGSHAVYIKTLGFQTDFVQLEKLLQQLDGLEMLVVPSAVTVQAGDPLRVTLRLTTFSAGLP